MKTLVPMIALLGLFLLVSSHEDPWQSQETPKPESEAPAPKTLKWREIKTKATKLNWLVQSPYGPSLMVEDGESFHLGKRTFTFKRFEDQQNQVHIALEIDSEEAQRILIPDEEDTISFMHEGQIRQMLVRKDDLGRRFLVPRSAVYAAPRKKKLLFIDANLNGRFDDELVDWVMRGEDGRFAFLYSKRLFIDSGTFHFTFDYSEDTPTLRYRYELSKLKSGTRDLQNTLNAIRMNFGLYPAEANSEWNAHCRAHASYMKKNNEFTHHEIRGKKGFTTKGHIAGMSSILSKGTMSATHAVYSLWDTPLHAFDIRSPYFTQASYAHIKPYSVIRSSGLPHRPIAFGKPWSFPPNNAINIPTSWPGKESPEPRIDTKSGFGYPITFSTQWGVVNYNQGDALKGENTRDLRAITRPQISSAVATLEAKIKDEWKKLEIQHTFDKASAPDSLKHWNWVHHYVLPIKALAPYTLHRLTLHWQDEDEHAHYYRSAFTTGDARGGHQWPTRQPRIAPKPKKRK